MKNMPLTDCKSSLYGLIRLIILILMMIQGIHGGCIEEERKALLEIKASLKSYGHDVDRLLPTWSDHEGGPLECCDWERVNCNNSAGHVTDLALEHLNGIENANIWKLNFSVFLHFKELTNLNLANNGLGNGIENTGFKRLSSLKKLEMLDLSMNNIKNNIIFRSLSALTSLKLLNLSNNGMGGHFPAHELSVLRELTTLDLNMNNFDSLEFNGTMSSLIHLNLDGTNFKKEVLRSFVAFPSLKFLSLANGYMEGVISTEDLPKLPNLEVLILRNNLFTGILPMEGLAYFRHLEVLDLSNNNFIGSIPSSIDTLSSLKELSLARNELGGSLPLQGFCELKNLCELDLSENMFEGDLTPCFSSLSSLKLLDLSLNQFNGNISTLLISNLTSLEYVDLGYNKFEGLFSFSSFSNHTKLEMVSVVNDNDKFEVETEEPLGWIPMFQLKVLVLSNCNLNRGSQNVPSFLLHQHELQVIDLSHNSLDGTFPNWLIDNNTRLEYFIMKNNSLGGTVRFLPHQYVNSLDISDNHLTGILPPEIGNIVPYIFSLNLSWNSLDGAIPLSMGNLVRIQKLDLSNNNFSREVPKSLLSDCPRLAVLILSNNKLDGEVLSRNLNARQLIILLLDNNRFTGVLANEIAGGVMFMLNMLDISGNLFSGMFPGWITNMLMLKSLSIRNNTFEGQFPCGTTPFNFLDISQNSFSGSIPSCSNLQDINHLHLDSNRFTGSIPESFRNLTKLLTLDIGNNKLSGRIPNFVGELSSLRILFLGKNNFSGSIPEQLCQLRNVSMIDLSSNSLSGSIPNCLQNTTGPTDLAFLKVPTLMALRYPPYHYQSVLVREFKIRGTDDLYEKQAQVQFITKSRLGTYKGGILDYMSGLDFSSNNLTGEIPKELGQMIQIRALNLSHNQLTGPIPSHFSNLENIESLDISSNNLSGKVPSELIGLNFLAVFYVSNNNLSGRLPEMKGQFGTFSADSYEGNPFLCGLPLEKKCTPNSTLMAPPLLAEEDEEKWYNVDMVFFGSSLVSTWFVFLMGFVGILYVNPNWRRRWLAFVEECMYTSYYFLYDCLHKRRI